MAARFVGAPKADEQTTSVRSRINWNHPIDIDGVCLGMPATPAISRVQLLCTHYNIQYHWTERGYRLSHVAFEIADSAKYGVFMHTIAGTTLNQGGRLILRANDSRNDVLRALGTRSLSGNPCDEMDPIVKLGGFGWQHTDEVISYMTEDLGLDVFLTRGRVSFFVLGSARGIL
jgi:hypothetical protein